MIFTGILMFVMDIEAWMASSMFSRLCLMCLRLAIPVIAVESPMAI